MLLKKRLWLIVLLIGFLFHLSAEENEQSISFYAGINPLALLSFLPNEIGAYATGFGIASNQEYGISLYGGMHFAQAHSLELRFSTGPDGAVWDTQLQFGYIWYPLEQFKDWNGGLSAGLMLRQFFWNHRESDYITFSFTPELLLGWRFKVKSLSFDVRAGWNMAYATWSTMPNAPTGVGSMPLPFNLTLTTGVAWLFSGNKFN